MTVPMLRSFHWTKCFVRFMGFSSRFPSSSRLDAILFVLRPLKLNTVGQKENLYLSIIKRGNGYTSFLIYVVSFYISFLPLPAKQIQVISLPCQAMNLLCKYSMKYRTKKVMSVPQKKQKRRDIESPVSVID